MHNNRDVMASVLLIIIGIAVIVWAFRLKVGTLLMPMAGFFPLLVGSTIILLSLALIVQAWMGQGKSPKAFGQWQKPVIMLVALVAYVVLLTILGYVLSTIFIVAIALRLQGINSWRLISFSSVILSLSTYILFSRLLAVELPVGILSFLG